MKKDYSQKQIAAELSIPIEHLRVSQELGFRYVKYNKWDVVKYKSWYEANKDAIEDYLLTKEDSPSEAGEKLKYERYLIARMQREEMEKKTLDKNKVIAQYKSIYNAVMIILRNAEQDNPQLMVGKDVLELTKIYKTTNDKIFELIQKQLDEWIKNGTMGTTNTSDGQAILSE